jgi:Autophagocytosis associated protein, active-site domain
MEPPSSSSEFYSYYWSELEFNNAVVQLVSALQQHQHQQQQLIDDIHLRRNSLSINDNNNETNESTSTCTSWYWERREEKKIMLIHEPFQTTSRRRRNNNKNTTTFVSTNLQSTCDSNKTNQLKMLEHEIKNENSTVIDENDDYLYIDSTIWMDEACDSSNDCISSIGTTTTTTVPKTSCSNVHTTTRDDDNTFILIWYLNCIYHETWQVPVLYFSVQNAHDGSPCTRDNVLEALGIGSTGSSSMPERNDMNTTNEKLFDQDEYIDNTWTTISMEEHPITGIPSYFLHPCRTAERLGTLFNPSNVATPSSNITMLYSTNNHHTHNRKEKSQESNEKPLSYYPSGIRLYSWLTMILSSLHIIQVSSKVFQKVQRQIMENDKRTSVMG